MMPNFFEMALPDIFKGQPRYRMCKMTGERKPFRIYHDKPGTPPIHTGFGIIRIIVRCDEEHFHCSPKPFPCPSCNGTRGVNLRASRQERHAIFESPSEILRICQLESVGGHELRENDKFLDLIDVVTMKHDVQGQREFERCDPLHGFELPME